MKPTPHNVLARMMGVRTAYRDAFGQWQRANPEALHAVLRALSDAPIDLSDARSAIDAWASAHWGRTFPPVQVLWDDLPPALLVRIPDVDLQGSYEGRIELETDGERRFTGRFDQLETVGRGVAGAVPCTERRLPLPGDLPWGYHRLELHWKDAHGQTLLIRAPHRAAGFAGAPSPSRHGAFLPLHALRTEQDWGAGDFSDLRKFSAWAGSHGLSAIATLPLLPNFLEEPFDPSPYSPVSRQFWGEHFIDPRAAPEFAENREARERVESPGFQAEVQTLRAMNKVDYARLWALKRPVLEALASDLRRSPGAWDARLRPFLEQKPDALRYARFRAVQERYRGRNWRLWSPAERSGDFGSTPMAPAVVDFYLYAQLLAHEQVGRLAGDSRSTAAPLYLDLPLGSHPDGFDHWSEQACFVEQMAVGAPPDPLFKGGQNWGFAPMHPGRIRAQGYRYFIACLRHHFASARMLRLDHAMGFHRLYWIPQGMGADKGVYVQYEAEDIYAILTLESRRHDVALIGEDLGTVPGYVRTSMDRHGISRTYALQLELREDAEQAMGEVPDQAAACVNTHDLPPFAAFWAGDDLEELTALGFYDEAERRSEHDRREVLRKALVTHFQQKGFLGAGPHSARDVLMACLRALRESPAAMTLVTLEDLWGERQRQNLPGTSHEAPNWQCKARLPLEAFDATEGVLRWLEEFALRPRIAGS